MLERPKLGSSLLGKSWGKISIQNERIEEREGSGQGK